MFVFGPQPLQINYEAEKEYAKTVAGMGGGIAQMIKQAQAQQNVNKLPPLHPTKVVDLCDVCVPIWLERVDKLCRASDPEGSN